MDLVFIACPLVARLQGCWKCARCTTNADLEVYNLPSAEQSREVLSNQQSAIVLELLDVRKTCDSRLNAEGAMEFRVRLQWPNSDSSRDIGR